MTIKTVKNASNVENAFGGMKLIQKTVLASSVAQVQFTNIPSNYSFLRIVVRAKSTSGEQPPSGLAYNAVSSSSLQYRYKRVTSSLLSANPPTNNASSYGDYILVTFNNSTSQDHSSLSAAATGWIKDGKNPDSYIWPKICDGWPSPTTFDTTTGVDTTINNYNTGNPCRSYFSLGKIPSQLEESTPPSGISNSNMVDTNTFGAYDMEIASYANGNNPVAHWRGGYSWYHEHGIGGVTFNTSVTTIKFFCRYGNFVAKSSFALYGIY